MLSDRFEHLLQLLIGAFLRYDDTPRDATHVVQLASARIALDDIRVRISSERDTVLGLGRSKRREDFWREQEASARARLFTLAHTST